MNNPWIRAQDRKRNFVAAASTACLYALAVLGAWAVGLLAPVTLASVPSTVIVELGGAEGPSGEVPQGLESAPDRPPGTPPGAAPLPAAGTAAPAAPSAAVPKEEPISPKASAATLPAPAPAKASVAKAVPKAPPKPAAKSVPAKNAPAPASSKTIPAKADALTPAQAAAAQAAADAQAAQSAQEEAALRAAAATAAATAGPPKTRTFGSGSQAASGSPVTSGGTGSAAGVAGGTGTVTFRGSEMGSSLTTTFGASSGQVGRNIYVPIYMYMPLPAKIDDSIYRNVQAKETFRSHYQASGSDWLLKSQIPMSQRGEFWTMLEAAGYDAAGADYKAGRNLKPVVLEFAVGPLAGKKVELVDVRLISSSGSSEVDEAVIYGFRQASFFNKTGNAVGGKFVYGF
jgi:outer membrane biosynthesis protein TonB